jgi:hypothetical protein
VRWQIAMKNSIGFKLQVIATPGFHSLYDLGFGTVWLYSGASDDPDNDTVIEKHSAEAFHSAVKSLMNAIWSKHDEAQQDVAHRMIQTAKPCTIRRWSQLKFANRKPLSLIAVENTHRIDLE